MEDETKYQRHVLEAKYRMRGYELILRQQDIAALERTVTALEDRLKDKERYECKLRNVLRDKNIPIPCSCDDPDNCDEDEERYEEMKLVPIITPEGKLVVPT